MFSVSKPIEFDGKVYQSQHELAKTFNLSISMISQLKNNPEKLKMYITNKIQGKTNKPIKNPYKNIGLIVGDFKVEEYLGQYQNKAFKYKAVCMTCGNTIIKDVYNLRKKCTCSKCHKRIKDKYVGTQIGDFKIMERIETPKNKFTKYRVVCTNCGYEKIQPIHQVKKDCKCKKCKMAIKVYNTFKKVKDNGLEHYDIISYSYERGKIYKYLLKCKHCGKEIWVNKNSINTMKTCECRKHENGKFMAKHHGEIINGWLLEDTGKNAYNSRNRLYKYTCTHCGHTYYDQYSQSRVNKLCICQKVQKKKLKVIKEKKKKNIKINTKHTLYVDFEFDGKVYHKPKEIADAFGIAYRTAWLYIKDNDLEGLELTIRQKIYRYKKRMKLL